MSKYAPHEQDWIAYQETLVDDQGNEEPADWWNVDNPVGCAIADCLSPETALLVASAPRMARLLLKILKSTKHDPWVGDAIRYELDKAGVPHETKGD